MKLVLKKELKKILKNVNMSKTCEIKPYIIKLTSDTKVQEKLNDIHNEIFEELDKSKNFNPYYEKLWEKDITKGYSKEVNQGRLLVNSINSKYGTDVVGWTNSKPTNKRYLFVNVKNLLGEQLKLFNKDITVDKKNLIVDEMITLFHDYAKENGIKVKFVESVLDENGNDVNAYYDSFTKVIKIKQGLESTDVFPEELAHHLTLALGEDHIAVKRAFNLISRLDYKGILGKEYVDAYNGDENLLKHEFLGKYIAKFLANPNLPNELNSENGIKLWDTIKNLLNRFICRLAVTT